VSNLTVSFVSGKGGVGKTSLAANFAWLCSRLGRTALVDLDLQNQGCTGLFLSVVPPDSPGVFDHLANGAHGNAFEPIRVDDDLYFIPAVTISHPPPYSEIADALRSSDLGSKLSQYLSSLRGQYSIEIVVLDCHGGLDYTSVAAKEASDHTIVVTEADAVTFNGTLELLDFYDRGPTDSLVPPGHDGGPNGLRPPAPKMDFVVNRLPPKYRFSDLDAAYNRLLQSYHGPLTLNTSVLSFIPDENFVADTFGQYPFVVKLAPRSIIARKLQLMVLELLAPQLGRESYRPFRRFKRERFKRKVRAATLSSEAKNVNNIIYAYGWITTAFSLLLIAYFVALYWVLSRASPAANALDELVGRPLFWGLISPPFLAFAYYSIRAQFGLMFYYRDKFRFSRSLLRAAGTRPGLWQRLALLKLGVLRVGSAIGPAVLIGLAGIYLLGGLFLLVDVLFGLLH
jgi:MinD-like ATPase involved in chromosome partitioning or flagellar assembly